MKQLSTKIFVGYLLVIALLAGLILLFSFKTLRDNYFNSSFSELNTLSSTLKWHFLPFIQEERFKELDREVKRMGSNINMRITITLPNGTVVADSKISPDSVANHKSRPEIIAALKGEIGQSIRYSSSIKEEMLYVATPLYDGTNIMAVVRVSIYIKELEAIMSQLRFQMMQVASIVIVVSLIAVLVFSRNISRPINQLSFAARKIASGDFDIKIEVKGNDELSELAQNFNNMSRRLKRLFDKVKSQSEELNTLLTNIKEGFAMINFDGEIVMANTSFETIIGKSELAGKRYKAVIHNSDFSKIFKDSKKSRSSQIAELLFEDRYFLCSTNCIESKDEIVFLLSDITEHKKLENYKKDFVTNVSHELRTPLTAIKGFLETVQEETDQDEIARYLNIISRHTNRLAAIVSDLLTLSELENANFKMILSNVDIKDLLENVSRIFEYKCKEKELFLHLDIDENLPLIPGDVFRLEQVFINLIDNAIKYTDKGGVSLRVFSEKKKIKIEVEDTGIGIPEKDQKRVFERFYLVDKSRSRKVGGTGLGLSIVKHIILNHGGDIKLESKVGIGAKFVISLPLKNHFPEGEVYA